MIGQLPYQYLDGPIMKRILLTNLALITTLGVPLASSAATQGTLGTTSTGSSIISATIQDAIIITGLTDISLGSYSGTGAMTASTNYCVYRNGTGKYSATLTGSGGITAGFYIKNGAIAEMAYTVTLSDGGAPIAATSGSTIGTALAPLSGNATSQNCGGGTNGTIAVTISQAAAQAAPSGVYSGLLTILVSPL